MILITDQILSQYNLSVRKGESIYEDFLWTDEDGNIVNLTGASGQFSVRKYYPKSFLREASSGVGEVSVSSISSTAVGNWNSILWQDNGAADLSAVVSGDRFEIMSADPLIVGTFGTVTDATLLPVLAITQDESAADLTTGDTIRIITTTAVNPPVLNLTSTPVSGFSLGGSAGTFVVSAASGFTTGIDVGLYKYNVRIATSGQSYIDVISGLFDVFPGVAE